MSDKVLDPITRQIVRTGKRVEIVTVIGDYISKPEVYELPSHQRARAFEVHASKLVNGIPAAIDMEWAEFRMEEEDEPSGQEPTGA